MPVVAIAPLLVAALGRGPVGIAVVVARMTFFPTLVSCLYGLRQATVAEWLATGTGVGNLMAVAAASSAYGTLWSSVVIVAVLAVLGYALVELIERRVLRVLAPEQTAW